MSAHAATVQKVASVNLPIAELSSNVVYLMGMSFVLGSFFTILVLILLDFMQRDRIGKM